MLVLAPSFGQAAKKKKIERKDQRPNILFILADDMGRECLGCYGSTYKTPNLDAFAQHVNNAALGDFIADTGEKLRRFLWIGFQLELFHRVRLSVF